MTSIYEFKTRTLSGKETDLSAYRGKVLVIVNTASQCGLTPQYADLQKLYEQYHAQGLEILGFPCNQFGGQEPGSNEEVAEFCQVNYGVTFPMFEKIDVNGPEAHPLYRYLKQQAPLEGSEDNGIQWNFTKFVVDREGRVVKRFEPGVQPMEMESEIRRLL
ncbi:glutathione peroxidase [Cohnella pontilimi]|uniref:Glutathione peroxidase n=1 Tax=Cohnella pontilimi TaxID=2564100 RepID=A0A4U0FI18_9BACL|nr:glutathione peroxidase [Cohnella pontilimi]TJY44611.1 glutathione peroxidase [Cohnella pontilimi]